MKNHIAVKHGMLPDLKDYLEKHGWIICETKGKYEVLRARNKMHPRPLIVWDRAEYGVGYSIDERDIKIYNFWKKDRFKRGLDPDWATIEESRIYWSNLK